MNSNSIRKGEPEKIRVVNLQQLTIKNSVHHINIFVSELDLHIAVLNHCLDARAEGITIKDSLIA